MLSQNQILFGKKMLQEVAISWDVPILKAAKILVSKEIDVFWKWINSDEFLNDKLYEIQNLFEEEKKPFQFMRQVFVCMFVSLYFYIITNTIILINKPFSPGHNPIP